ncbi:unnamed protein product [Lota lota]
MELVPEFCTKLVPEVHTVLVPKFYKELVPEFCTELVPEFCKELVPQFCKELDLGVCTELAKNEAQRTEQSAEQRPAAPNLGRTGAAPRHRDEPRQQAHGGTRSRTRNRGKAARRKPPHRIRTAVT